MAKTWTLLEAYIALQRNDKAAILDFGKRFPLATNAVSKITNAEDMLAGLPSHMTMRKLEMALKGDVNTAPEEDDEEAVTPEEAKAKKAAKADPAKKEKKPVTAKKGRPAKKVEEPVEEPEEEEDEAEEAEEQENSYDGMTAPELFKLCKKRGIKAEPKQKAAVYIGLLQEADKKMQEDDDEEEADDSWDDDEEEEAPAPKKAPAKGKAKPVKAPAKAAKKDADDDWDI